MPRNHGPWIIKASRIAYQNPWFKLREDAVIQPDGAHSTHVVIEDADGICALALDNDNNLYLAREFKYGLGRHDLNAVGGGINPKEPSLKAAKRELKEELGITAKKWISLGITNSWTTLSNSTSHLYLARDLTFGQTEHEGTESIQPHKIKFDQAVKMVFANKISHAPTVVAIFKAREYLRNDKCQNPKFPPEVGRQINAK